MAEHETGARRALPGEGTGMSGVVELAEQLAAARARIRELEDALDMAADRLRSEGHYEWSAEAYAPLESA